MRYSFPSILLIVAAALATGCTSAKLSEDQRFMSAFRKDVPFTLDTLTQIGNGKYCFSNVQYVNTEADDEIHADGSIYGLRTTFDDPKGLPQDSSVIWRNLFFNRREQRVVCVDRMVRDGRTVGMVYTLQSENRKYPTLGTYHWDVSDPRAMQHTARILKDNQKESVAKLRAGTMPSQWCSAASLSHQKEYNRWVGKADSCYYMGNYFEADYYFDKALQLHDCIQGSELYNAACVASLNGKADKAVRLLEQRMKMYPDWYMQDLNADRDFDGIRQTAAWKAFAEKTNDRRTGREKHYDKPLMEELMEIGRLDQQWRGEYLQALNQQPKDTAKADSIARLIVHADSVNLRKVCHILDTRSFVGKSVVGNACNSLWMVIQHSTVEYQRKYIPMFRAAASRGDLSKESVALMEDRINCFEGRPQRYGSQITTDKDGRRHVYTLEDPAKVDEWRKEMGMQPLDVYLKRMNATR